MNGDDNLATIQIVPSPPSTFGLLATSLAERGLRDVSEIDELIRENKRLHELNQQFEVENKLLRELYESSQQLAAENRRLQDQQQQAVREISVKNQQLRESLQKLEQIAATDSLTGIYTRRYFDDALNRHFVDAAHYNHDVVCVMCGLDGFKKLNDVLGHQFGDKVLQVTSRIITWNLCMGNMVARYRSDEFAILIPKVSSEAVLIDMERIRSQFIFQMTSLIPAQLCLTLSMGIASVQGNRPANSDQLLVSADEAMREAKRRGKNKIVVSQKISPANSNATVIPVASADANLSSRAIKNSSYDFSPQVTPLSDGIDARKRLKLPL